ncbi:MAG: methyltransferase domain-containing protein [Nitrososphaerota archaeon]
MTKLKEQYDILAECYDDLYNNPQINYMHEIEKKVLLKYIKQGLVLDIGCGTGKQTLFLAKKHVKVIGLDISNEMIRKALEKAKNKNICDCFFIVGSGEFLPFKNNSFNNIISFFGALNHMPKYEIAIKEISRVLKKKGMAIISVANNFSIHWFLQEIKKGLSSIIKNFLKNEEYICIKILNGKILNIWTHYFSPKNLISLFKRNGFKTIKLGSIFLFVPPNYSPCKSLKMKISLRILFIIENIFRWVCPFNFFGEYLFLISEKL